MDAVGGTGDANQAWDGMTKTKRITRAGGVGRRITRPFFQMGAGGSTPTPALDWLIVDIPHSTAKCFIEQWHYSKRMPTGKNICYGLCDRGELYAVIIYGIGVNPYQASFLKVRSVIEIKRMCRTEPQRNYQLSRFIALTSKMVYRVSPFDAIVAFADPANGHEGIVYKASGFIHHGMTGAENHLIDDTGTIRHRRFAFRYARRKGITTAAAREELGLSVKQTPPKHRWVRARRVS